MSSPWKLKWIVACALALGVAVGVVACGGGKGSAASAPTGFTVTAGEQSATITWNDDPTVEYWLVYTAGTSISATPTPTGPHTWAIGVTSPYTVTGLTNGTTYAFAMNGRINGGPGGPSTASQTAVPRPAGGTWTLDTTTSGAQMASTDAMTGIAYDGSANYLAVGNDTTTGPVYTGTVGSTSSIVWTSLGSQTIPFNGVAYWESTDGFVAVGNGGYCQGTSFATPTCTTTPGINWYGVASNGTQAIMVGSGGNILHADTAGGAWSAITGTTVSGGQTLYGVAYVGSIWVAVGQSGAIYSSSDGINWSPATGSGTATTSTLYSVAAYGSTAVAVGASGAVVTSADTGVTWVAQTAVSGGNKLNAVNVSSDQILVVGNGGAAYTSPLSTTPTWTTVATGTANNLTAVTGSSSAYYVVGSGGTSLWSK